MLWMSVAAQVVQQQHSSTAAAQSRAAFASSTVHTNASNSRAETATGLAWQRARSFESAA